MVCNVNIYITQSWSEKHNYDLYSNYKGIHEDLKSIDQLACHNLGSSSLSPLSITITKLTYSFIRYFESKFINKLFIPTSIVLIQNSTHSVPSYQYHGQVTNNLSYVK